MAFVREVTGYVRNRVPGYVIEVYIEQVGDKNIVHWFSDAESMVDIARVSVLLSEDETYQGYIQIGSSLFIPESNVEEVMVAID